MAQHVAATLPNFPSNVFFTFLSCGLYMLVVVVIIFLCLLLCHLFAKAIFAFMWFISVVFVVVVAHSHSWLAFWFYLISMLPRQIVRTSGVCPCPRTCWKGNLLWYYCWQRFCAICLISIVFPYTYHIHTYIHMCILRLFVGIFVLQRTVNFYAACILGITISKEHFHTDTHTYKHLCT